MAKRKLIVLSNGAKCQLLHDSLEHALPVHGGALGTSGNQELSSNGTTADSRLLFDSVPQCDGFSFRLLRFFCLAYASHCVFALASF